MISSMSGIVGKIKIASIDVTQDQVLQVLCNACRHEEFDTFWTSIGIEPSSIKNHLVFKLNEAPSESLSGFVEQTHVTMAHRSRCSQKRLRELFKPFIGSIVTVTASALLWSHRVAALSIKLPDHDHGTLPACQNAFPHITVWLADGAKAQDSNELPILVENGLATRVDFKKVMVLEGVISLWRNEGESE
ncbi:hypothetical protein MPSEU_000092600 [Mayamaea pseudoterrestris]|nr:hypothetical protein MPSEU_000092600 [Mayamaea pseudoterrestris]